MVLSSQRYFLEFWSVILEDRIDDFHTIRNKVYYIKDINNEQFE